MTEPPPRKRFQIHLSTAIVMMFVAGGLIWGIISAISWIANRNKWETIQVTDVTQPIVFNLKATSDNISGIRLHIIGVLDGDGEIWVGDGIPVRLTGKVDRHIYTDWFYPNCDVHYKPLTARKGQLSINYKLE